MKHTVFKSVLFACFFAAGSHALSSRHLDLHFGLSPSKSTLGIGIGDDLRELNAGLKNQPLEWFATRDVILQPGISYNHRIPGGFQASATYAPVFVRFGENGPYDVFALSRRKSLIGDDYWLKDGWNAGEIFIGLGRTFQFDRFGIIVDGNLITPATEDLARSWAYWIGFGISYRLRLD
jgi:hypothetical protein